MLDICREHGHPPSWWNTLSRDDRAQLLAWRTYRHEQHRRARAEAKQ